MEAPSDQTKGVKCRAGLHWMTEANTAFRKNGRGSIIVVCRKCKRSKERAYRKAHRAKMSALYAAERARARATGLDPDDPRHGTKNGYGYYGCRCVECVDANSTAARVTRLRKKAKALGVLPKDTNVIACTAAIFSLDAMTAANPDQLLNQTIWSDPTAEAVMDEASLG